MYITWQEHWSYSSKTVALQVQCIPCSVYVPLVSFTVPSIHFLCIAGLIYHVFHPVFMYRWFHLQCIPSAVYVSLASFTVHSIQSLCMAGFIYSTFHPVFINLWPHLQCIPSTVYVLLALFTVHSIRCLCIAAFFIQDFLGSLECTLGEILGSMNNRLEKPLVWVKFEVSIFPWSRKS